MKGSFLLPELDAQFIFPMNNYDWHQPKGGRVHLDLQFKTGYIHPAAEDMVAGL